MALATALLTAGQLPARADIRWEPLNEPGCGGWITSVSVSPHDSRRVLVGGDMLGAALSTDQGDSWNSTFGFESWELADFTWDPKDSQRVWAGTMSGPYLSTDGGRNWQSRREGMPKISGDFYSAPIQKVLFDPNDNKRLIAVGGSHRRWHSPGKPLWGAVWESRDSGDHWNKISEITGPNGAGANIMEAAFASGSSQLLYAAADKWGVYASSDGGKTWEARNGGLPHTSAYDLAVHPKQPGTLWVALDNTRPASSTTYLPGGVFKSTDGGAHWQPVSGLSASATGSPDLTARYAVIAVAPSAPDKLLVSNSAWDSAGIYGSTDGGSNWQVLARRKDIDTPMPSGLNLTVAEFDPRNANNAFVAGAEYLLRTTDAGRTWQDVTAQRVGRQPDDWRGRGFQGWVSSSFKFNPRDPKNAVFLAWDHGNFWQSRDGLKSWQWGSGGLPSWGGATEVSFSAPETIYVTLGQTQNFAGIAKSTDNGQKWEIMRGPAYGLPAENAPAAKAVGIYSHPADDKLAWATVGGKLYRTVNGREWVQLPLGPGLGRIIGSLKEPTHFFIAGSDGIYETRDGENFVLMPGSPRKSSSLAVDGQDQLYATAWRQNPGGLWRFSGTKWDLLNPDRYIAAIAADPTDFRRLALITDDHPYHDKSFATGVWLSSDAGQTWKQANNGLAVARGEVITFNPHDPTQLVVGTAGRGFFTGHWPK